MHCTTGDDHDPDDVPVPDVSMLAWDVLPSEAEARDQRVTRPLRRLANARVDPINLSIIGRQGQRATPLSLILAAKLKSAHNDDEARQESRVNLWIYDPAEQATFHRAVFSGGSRR